MGARIAIASWARRHRIAAPEHVLWLATRATCKKAYIETKGQVMFGKNTDYHDDWEREHWADQPEPEAGSRADLEKFGGYVWAEVVLIVSICVMAVIGGAALGWAASLPIVQESWATGHCVAVIDPAGVYSCENMPARFYHEWVK